MKTSFYLLPFIFAAALPLAPAARARSIDMIAVAEQTNKGAMVAPPTTDNPAYYIAYDGGYIEAGDPIAGEKPPTPAVIGQTLRQALAAQGYQPAPGGVSPSLLLIYHWGSINRDSFQTSRFTKIEPNLKARIYLVASWRSAAMLENFLLSRRLAPIANNGVPVPGFLGPDLHDILSRADDDRYFVVVSAYDYAAITRREPTLLWRVKLSARSTSSAMYKVLPALISGGGPFFGHHLPEARFLNTPLYPFGEGAATAPQAPMPPPPAVASQLDAAFVSHLVKQEHDWFSGEDVTDPAAEASHAEPDRKAAADREPSQSSFPPALTKQIAGYQQEKFALQEALAARIKARTPGADSRAAIDAFNQENAGRIAALAKTREAIRDQLARLAAANTNPAAAGSLNALLKEYSAEIQQLEPPSDVAAK